jgi:hypothetical protein
MKAIPENGGKKIKVAKGINKEKESGREVNFIPR